MFSVARGEDKDKESSSTWGDVAVFETVFAERAAAENDLAVPLETADVERAAGRAAPRADLQAARRKEDMVRWDGRRDGGCL